MAITETTPIAFSINGAAVAKKNFIGADLATEWWYRASCIILE